MISEALRQQYLWDTVPYANGQKLDIWSKGTPRNAPVFVFIPGGGWLIGDRRHQGHAIMSHLVDQGWICVTMDYRTPRWPDPFTDVCAAWDWTRENIHQYGGGDFIAVGGASAGGHMASLLGVTDNSIDRPDAVVSLYGVYSWDSPRPDHFLINQWVKGVVRPKDLYAASPIHHVHDSVPPFLIIHGDRDVITPESGAKAFYRKLATVSDDAGYLKVRGGHHGFDLFQKDQTAQAIAAIEHFLTRQIIEFKESA